MYEKDFREAYIQAFHGLHKASRSSASLWLGVIKLESFEKFRSWVAPIPLGHTVDLLDEMTVQPFANNALHHGKVLEVVVGLEQRITSEKLHQDAANAPDITRKGPSQTKNDLRGPVVPCGYNRRVILVLEGGRTKIDQSDFGIEKDFALSGLSIDGGGRRRYPSAICEGLVGAVTEEDILWLEIGVD